MICKTILRSILGAVIYFVHDRGMPTDQNKYACTYYGVHAYFYVIKSYQDLFPFHFNGFVAFNYVADLDVVETFDVKAAFHTSADLFDVILKPFQ